MDHAYRRGMANDWIAADTIILKVKCPNPNAGICVPSTLDGLHSPIFVAVPEAPRPGEGRALDLADIENGTLGARECVATTIPAEDISFRLVSIPSDARLSGRWLDALQTTLLKYYRSQT